MNLKWVFFKLITGATDIPSKMVYKGCLYQDINIIEQILWNRITTQRVVRTPIISVLYLGNNLKSKI